jgi:hypothetical protein
MPNHTDRRKARSQAFFESKAYLYPYRPRPTRKVRVPAPINPQTPDESDYDYNRRRLSGLRAWAGYYARLAALKREVPDSVGVPASDILTLRARVLQDQRQTARRITEYKAEKAREAHRRARRAYEARHPGRRGDFLEVLLSEKKKRE